MVSRNEKIRQWHEVYDHQAVCTVKHSGTVSLQQEYPPSKYRFLHCVSGVLDFVDDLDFIATTYRDPLRVAASWVNRYGEIDKQEWVDAWDVYNEVSKRANVLVRVEDLPVKLNSKPDKFGLHAALDRGDMDFFHKKVGRELIDYAISKCEHLNG